MSTFKPGDEVRRNSDNPWPLGNRAVRDGVTYIVGGVGSDGYTTLKGVGGIRPDRLEVCEGPTLEEIRAKWAEEYHGLGHYLTVEETKRFEEFLNPPPPKPPTAEEVLLGVISSRRGALWTNVAKDAVNALREAGLLKED